MALIWKKRLLLTYFSHFLVTMQGIVTKIPSAHISLTYIHVFLLTLLTFLPYQFKQKIPTYQVWFLYGVIPGYSYSRHFGAINK